MNEFPHTVEVQQLEQVRLPGGGYEDQWTHFKDVPCQIAPITDDKRLEAMNEVENVIYEWFVPYSEGKDITSDMRVLHEGDKFELRGRGKDLGGVGEIFEYTLRLITP